MNRRRFLATTAAVTVPVVAGCLGDGNGSGGSGGETTAPDGETTVTVTTTEATTSEEDTSPGDETGTDETVGDTTTAGSDPVTETGRETETTAGTAAGTTASTTVRMVETSFDPVRASVDPGTTVEWVNEDGFAHDVTSTQFHDSAAQWDIGQEVSSGGSVTHTFDSEGVYEYYCTIHGESTMCGVVLIGGASLDATLPCEGGGGGTTGTDTGGDGGGDDGDNGDGGGRY